MFRPERKLRIVADRFYLLAKTPGISGFKQWDKRSFHVVLGVKARRERDCVIGEFTPDDGTYRLDDGHLPEYQPVVSATEAISWLRANPYRSAQLLPK